MIYDMNKLRDYIELDDLVLLTKRGLLTEFELQCKVNERKCLGNEIEVNEDTPSIDDRDWGVIFNEDKKWVANSYTDVYSYTRIFNIKNQDIVIVYRSAIQVETLDQTCAVIVLTGNNDSGYKEIPFEQQKSIIKSLLV